MPQLVQQLRIPRPAETARPHTLAEWRSSGADYALDKGLDIGGVLLSIFVVWLFIRFISRRIEHSGEDAAPGLRTAREQRARTAAKLVRNVGRAVLTIVAVLMVLNQLDFNIGPLLASAGVVGLAVSFGSQSLVRDYVTGFFLQLEHQFALGDVVRIGSAEGTVENISLRLVYVRDGTGALHIIPNGQINQVVNLTRSWGRISQDVVVSWKDSDGAAEAVRRAAASLADDKAWEDALLDPPRLTGIEKIGDGVITLRAVARVDPYRRDDVARELRRRVKVELDQSGIVTVAPPLPALPA
jgi:moderate conductance mechanosensitive channel